MARCSRSAATELSTPPDRPQMTRPSAPTCLRMLSTASSMKPFIVHDPETLQSLKRKARSMALPCGVWTTSGWNWKPYQGCVAWAAAAKGELPLRPMASKPGGSASTRSPWLIHTCTWSPGRNSAKGPRAERTSTAALPNSRWALRSMRPPSSLARSWSP